MKVTITSIHQLLPSSKVIESKSVALSHIDTWHSKGRSSLVWLYPGPHETVQPSELVENLRVSLSKVLNKFPQYSGKLDYTVPTDSSTQSKRLCLTWGTENDPGVHYVTAAAASPLTALLPSARTSNRSVDASGSYAWDRTGRSCIGLWPAVPLNKLYETCIQITTFECGGFSLGITMNHALADATTVIFFVKHWSKTHELMFNPRTPQPSLAEPYFAPHLVDQHITADLEGEKEAKRLEKAHQLPTLRNETYDMKPEELPTRLELSETYSVGDQIPVGDWEKSGNMRSYMLHFSKVDINALWETAKEQAGPCVSRQAAIVSYIWLAIIRARGWDKRDVEEPINLFMTLDVRRRIGLADTLLGSPVSVTHISFKGDDSISKSHGLLANKIWTTLSMYDAEALDATLHHVSTSLPLISPAIWLSGWSILYSSLCHTNMYDVIFHGIRPALASPAFAGMGGMIGLIKSKPTETTKLQETYEDGIDMFFELDKASAAKLFSDPTLSMFDQGTGFSDLDR
ncbi:transferase family [Fusarium phyllophilum]|uniref:Transferase family n=1 Tax=Fusarium phyllophilum TaxID=47803 RepID=A0A8H5MK03_9HYPO|nr:transferase family [Fusarium phyllophilum]